AKDTITTMRKKGRKLISFPAYRGRKQLPQNTRRNGLPVKLIDSRWREIKYPTFKGSECPCRFFELRALHTTRSRCPVHHRPAGDKVGHQRTVRPLDHLSIIAPVRLVQTRPTRLPPLGWRSGLCCRGAAGHACVGTDGPVSGSRCRGANPAPSASLRPRS